jgi:hypothetical protein
VVVLVEPPEFLVELPPLLPQPKPVNARRTAAAMPSISLSF